MSIFSNAYTTEQKVQAVFVGLLGRAAKTAGLDHYVAAIDNPTNNYGIAEMLSELVNTQPEYINAVAGMGRAQLVTYHFENLFGRLPTFDDDGNNYWINGPGAAVPADLLVTALIDGASAADQLVLENKISVAIYMENNPGWTIEQSADILATVTSDPASVTAAKAAVDAALDPTGDTFILTSGQDIIDGTAKDDTFSATENTLDTGDNLDGGDGDDVLVYSVDGDGDYFFSAPTLNSIETIRVNAPSIYDTGIEIDLSNSDGYNVLESFQTQDFYGGEDSWLQFSDIQNINGTDIRIIDSNIEHYYGFDSNASLSMGGNDDIVDLYLSEVDGSYIELFTQGASDSHVDQINITSATRTGQPNDTTFNYLSDLWAGTYLNTVMIDGDADLEVEDYLDWNVNLVDASGLDADLVLDLFAQRLVWNINNTVNEPATTVLNYIGAQGDDNLDVGGGEDGFSNIALGTGNDDLTVGQIGYYGEDTMLGYTTVDAGDGNDIVSMSITGLQDVSLGAGNDDLSIFGHVDDLTTVPMYDGVGLIDAGDGDDDVFVGGGEDVYSIGAYSVDLGAGQDDLEMWVDGNPTVTAGAGNDTAVINVLSDVTFFGNDGDDNLTINGDGVHMVDMGNGNDWVDINGDNVSGPGDFVDYGADTVTTITTGAGNDSVDVSHNHYLDATLGAGDDQITLRAEDLTADDIVRGDQGDDTQEGSDTMILTNTNGEWVVIGDSETSSTVGIETFDLRNQNLRINLTEQMFNTANGDDVTVSTRQANGIELPVLYTAAGVLAAEQFDQGMSRAEYETIRVNMLNGVYSFATVGGVVVPVTLDIEDFLLNNGVDIIDFLDDDLTGDGSQVDMLGENPVASTFPTQDSVYFQLEPEGEMIVDVTDVPLTLLSGRTFTLDGGNIKDTVIANDASINGRSILRFDDVSANNSIEDTLIVEGAATISAADLREVVGLENIILKSDANSSEIWNIELSDRVINQTTGSATLFIKVDAEVPAGSRLNITLDDSVPVSTNDVVIEGNNNIEVYINGTLVTENDMINGTDFNSGPNSITVQEALMFTTNADSLIGAGNFYAQSVNQVQESDSAEGLGEDDTLYLGFAPSNAGDDLEDQLNDVMITGIEHVRFTTSDFTGLTGNNVQMERLSLGEDFLDNLQSLTTGVGDDFLGEMEGENYYGDVIEYYLNAGDDFFNGEDSDSYYVDAGAGNDTVDLDGNADDSTVYGGAGDDDITTGEGDDYIDGGTGNDTIDAGEGNDEIYGGTGNDDIYAGEGDDYVEAGDGNDEVYGDYGSDTIYGGNGNDYIDGGEDDDDLYGGAGNDTIYGGEGDDYIEGNAGDDFLSGEDGDDTIHGGDGNDTIDADSGDTTVTGGAGDDDITVDDTLDTADSIDGGTGNDSLSLTVADVLTDVDFTNLSNLEALFLSSGSDGLTGAAEFEAAGFQSVYAGAGDDALDFSAVTSASPLFIDGGTGADTIEGGRGSDTINAGTGADSVDSSTGADMIDLGVDADVDTVAYSESFHGALTGVGTGADMITSFNTADDMLEILGNLFTAIDANTDTFINVAANNNAVDASVDELVVDTSQAVTDADLTTDGFANLLAHLNNGLQTANAGDNLLYLVQGQSDTALYFYQEDTGNGNIEANEIRLIGVFDNALLDAANVGNTV